MTNKLLVEFVSSATSTKTLLLFGGNPERRHEIISLLQPLTNLSVYGALSEEEGLDKLKSLSQVDIILIGGRYTEEQRERIRGFVKDNYPDIKITEPGYHYSYSNENILKNVQKIVNNETTQ